MKQQLRESGPEGFLIFKILSIFYFKSNPVGIYLLKVNNRKKVKEYVKYVQC